jgi:hypothetical protein
MKLLFSLMFVVALYGLISCRPQNVKDAKDVKDCQAGYYQCPWDPDYCCPIGSVCGPQGDPHCYGPQINKVATVTKNGTL